MTSLKKFEYILDTSFLRSQKREVLQRARDIGCTLLVSPMSIWELLCHARGDDFSRAKAWFANAAQCRVLEHPIVEHANEIRGAHLLCAAALEERPCAEAIVDAMCAAADEASLENARFGLTLPNGGLELRGIAEALTRVNNELARLENEHLEFIETNVARREDLRHVIAASDYTDEEYKRAIDGDISHKYRDAIAHGIQCKGLYRRLHRSLYVMAAYNLERGIRMKTTRAKHDRNDYEDGLIAAHVRLHDRRILVTSDKGSLAALEQAFLRLRAWRSPANAAVSRHPFAISATSFVDCLGQSPRLLPPIRAATPDPVGCYPGWLLMDTHEDTYRKLAK